MNSSDRACVIITLGIAVVALNGVTLASLSLGRVLVRCHHPAVRPKWKGGGGSHCRHCHRHRHESGCRRRGIFLSGCHLQPGRPAGRHVQRLWQGGSGLGLCRRQLPGAALSTAGGTNQQLVSGVLTSQLYETLAAIVLFFLLPASAGKMLVQFGNMDSGAADAATVKDVLLSRLHYASTALKDISSTTHQVSDKLGRLESEPNVPIYTRACDRVCKSCRRNPSCWQLQYSDTVSALEKAAAAIRQKGSVSSEDLPADFTGRCVKLQPLIDNINIANTDLLNRRSARQQVSQVRTVVTDQFEGMSILLDEMAACMGEIVDTDAKLTQRLRAYLERISLGVISVGSFQDRFGKTTIEMVIPSYKLSRLDKED